MKNIDFVSIRKEETVKFVKFIEPEFLIFRKNPDT